MANTRATRSGIAALMAGTLALAACGSDTGSTASKSTAPSTSASASVSASASASANASVATSDSAPASAPAVAEPAKSDVTLTFWHYFADRSALFEQYAKDYQAKTGVKVKLEVVSGDVLGQKFQAAAQAKRLPDVAAAWAPMGEKLAPYAKAGQMLRLDDALAKDGWGDMFAPESLKSISWPTGNKDGVEPGTYLLPLDTNNMQVMYNTKLFEKAGVQPPKSFEEFLAVSAQLKKAGITPFVAGFGSWPLPSFANIYQWNIIGQEAMEATFAGKQSYTTEPWLKMLGTFQKLGQSGALAAGALAMDAPAAEALFANGKAAMMYDGSWAIGVLKQQRPDFKDYDTFLPPSAGEFPIMIPGGVGAQVFVVGTSKHTEEATAFIRWLSEKEQQAKYAEESLNLPANIAVAETMELSPQLAGFADDMKLTMPALKVGMPAPVETTMVAGLQQILAGKSTPEAVAAKMDAAQKSGAAQ